jgi:hypothetical protein
MILFVCLCLCLVLAGLAMSQLIQAALEDLRLALFGVRVRVPSRPASVRLERPSLRLRHGILPPVRVQTWAGTGVLCPPPTVPPHGPAGRRDRGG